MQPWKFRRHFKNIHENIRHECNQCQKLFSTNDTLNVHIQNVHQRKKYVCALCEISFNTRTNLSVHKSAKHEKGKRFDCTKCSKQYSAKSALKTHVQNAHDGKKYSCQYCNEEFNCNSSVLKHVKSLHENKRYPCEKCDQTFTSKGSLERHTQNAHYGTGCLNTNPIKVWAYSSRNTHFISQFLVSFYYRGWYILFEISRMIIYLPEFQIFHLKYFSDFFCQLKFVKHKNWKTTFFGKKY